MREPRRPPGSVKGQPTAEPHRLPQHPSLSIKLSSAVSGRGASRALPRLGCPVAHYKPRCGGGGQARPHVHAHSTRAPLHSRSRRASVPSICIESEHGDGPGRKRAAFALDDGPAMLPHRHAIDANPVASSTASEGRPSERASLHAVAAFRWHTRRFTFGAPYSSSRRVVLRWRWPRSLECYFFFTTRPSCTSRSRCPSRTSGSTAGRCSCCICG